MIESLKANLKELRKEAFQFQSREYMTGYISAISTIEGIIAELQDSEWIPITYREITEEERKENGLSEDFKYIFTCPMPDNGDEIIISMNNGKRVEAVGAFRDDYEVWGPEAHDWIHEVDAWMPMPKGYVKRGD